MNRCVIRWRAASCAAALGAVALGMNFASAATPKSNLKQPEQFSAAADDASTYAYLNDSSNGTPETGTVEIVRERYPDGTIKLERCVTLDTSGNYVNHGAWKMYTAKGEVVAEGQFDMGKRTGVWTHWYGRSDAPVLNEFPYKKFKAPFLSTANFIDGQIDGEWLIEDADKKKCEQITFKMGHRHGPSITWLPTGKVYRQATFDEGVPIGDVMEVNEKSGELARSATYVDGRKIITKTTNYKSGKSPQQKKTEALYLAAPTVQKSADEFWNLRFAEYSTEGKDLRHGPSKAWYANGKPQEEGFYQNDKKSGTFTYWHENGQIAATGEYKDDQPQGMWVWYHENGQKSAIGKYDSGTLIGDWRWWDEQGKLTKQKTYDGSEHISGQPQNPLDIGQRPADEDDTSIR